MPYAKANDPYHAGARPRRSISSLGTVARVLAPSDAEDFDPYPKAVRCDAAGTVKFLPLLNDDAAPMTIEVAAGEIIPWRVRRIWSTGTDANTFHAIEDAADQADA